MTFKFIALSASRSFGRALIFVLHIAYIRRTAVMSRLTAGGSEARDGSAGRAKEVGLMRLKSLIVFLLVMVLGGFCSGNARAGGKPEIQTLKIDDTIADPYADC